MSVVQGKKKCQQNAEKEEYKIKICFLGSSGVGKTCLVRRFSDNIYDPDTFITLGVAFVRKFVCIEDKNVLIEIWDTAGQERYESLIPMYYRGAGIIVVVFDVNDEKTFIRAQKWITEIENNNYHTPNQTIMLLGNKSDDNKKINLREKYTQYAEKNNIIYFECSAKTGLNVISGINECINKHFNDFYEDMKMQKKKEKEKEKINIGDKNATKKNEVIKCCN